VIALEELGPTFVKFGQMLSVRSDVFSDELVSEIAKLRDAATTFPAEAARRIIEEETGKPLALALIIASIVIGSPILFGAHVRPHLEGIPLLGIIGFMAAAALAIACAIIAFRSGKLQVTCSD
jgi:ubiquinone biosynthesis protein